MPDRPAPETDASVSGLRVLMLTPSYAPRVGGVEKHVKCVARELTRRGVDVRIVTPRWEGDWAGQETVEGVEVIRVSLDKRVGRQRLAPVVEWADVIHTHDVYPFLKYYLPYRFRNPRTPVFATFHGYEGYPIPLEAKVLRRLVLWLTKGNLCAGAFIPKWYRFRADHVTHGGVDAPPARPSVGEGAVFVGRLEPDTGFLTCLDAVRLLHEQHGLALPLEVCGDGSLRGEAEALAESHGLDLTFHGRVEDVTPFLRRARFAFVTGYLGMLEAMAFGAAVLAVYDNPLKEDYLQMFPGAAHMVVAESAQQLADELVTLVRDSEAVDEMTSGAYEFARTQTWENVADSYAALFASARRGQPEP